MKPKLFGKLVIEADIEDQEGVDTEYIRDQILATVREYMSVTKAILQVYTNEIDLTK